MTVAVIGGTGFTGERVVRLLAERRQPSVVVARMASSEKEAGRGACCMAASIAGHASHAPPARVQRPVRASCTAAATIGAACASGHASLDRAAALVAGSSAAPSS